jgi:hypothetical protein
MIRGSFVSGPFWGRGVGVVGMRSRASGIARR